MITWANSFVIDEVTPRALDVRIQRSHGHKWTIRINGTRLTENAVPFRASDSEMSLDDWFELTSVRRSQTHVFWRNEWEKVLFLGHSLERYACIVFDGVDYTPAIDGSDFMLLPMISPEELPFFLLCVGCPFLQFFDKFEVIPLVESSHFAKAHSLFGAFVSSVSEYIEPAMLMADSSISRFSNMNKIRLSLTHENLVPEFSVPYLLRDQSGSFVDMTIEVSSVAHSRAIRIVGPLFIPAWMQGSLVSELPCDPA